MTNIDFVVLLVIVAEGLLLADVYLRLALRVSRRTHDGSERLAASLDERAVTLPLALASARAALAEQGAAAEHALWTLKRADEQLAAATVALAARRAGLDALRERLDRTRAGVATLKSAARLIMRAIELRRAILG